MTIEDAKEMRGLGKTTSREVTTHVMRLRLKLAMFPARLILYLTNSTKMMMMQLRRCSSRESHTPTPTLTATYRTPIPLPYNMHPPHPLHCNLSHKPLRRKKC